MTATVRFMLKLLKLFDIHEESIYDMARGIFNMYTILQEPKI